jgi:hypothetical protein
MNTILFYSVVALFSCLNQPVTSYDSPGHFMPGTPQTLPPYNNEETNTDTLLIQKVSSYLHDTLGNGTEIKFDFITETDFKKLNPLPWQGDDDIITSYTGLQDYIDTSRDKRLHENILTIDTSYWDSTITYHFKFTNGKETSFATDLKHYNGGENTTHYEGYVPKKKCFKIRETEEGEWYFYLNTNGDKYYQFDITSNGKKYAAWDCDEYAGYLHFSFGEFADGIQYPYYGKEGLCISDLFWDSDSSLGMSGFFRDYEENYSGEFFVRILLYK